MRLLLFSILSFLTISAQAQLSFTTLHKKGNEETKNKDEAHFVKVLTLNQEDQSVHVKETFLSTNTTKLIGTHKSFKEKFFIGQKIEAYENKKLKSKEFYSLDGKLIDTAYYYHPNGKLSLVYEYPYTTVDNKTKITDTLILIYQDSLGNRTLSNGNGYAELHNGFDIEKGNYENHKKVGEWKGSFMSDKFTFVEIYENNKLISGTTTDSTGTTYTYDNSNFMVQPDYPGGINTLRQQISTQFRYPKEAIMNRVNGTIQATFIIDKTGKMVEIKIKEDLGYGTGEEFARVLRSAKKWKPGMMRGVPVRVAYTLPLRLNTQ